MNYELSTLYLANRSKILIFGKVQIYLPFRSLNRIFVPQIKKNNEKKLCFCCYGSLDYIPDFLWREQGK